MAKYKMVQGNSIVFNYAAVDDAGNIITLGGASIDWCLKRKASDEPVLTKSLSDGITVILSNSGTFKVTLVPDDTLTDDFSDYHIEEKFHMEAVVTDSLGGVYTITDDDGEPDILKIRPRYTEAT